MAELIINLIDRIGYFGVFLIMLVETVFPPIPSEIVMPFTGFAAAQGKLDLFWAIIFGALGSLTGATILYLIARLVSDESLNRFIDKHGGWLTVEREELDRARNWFNKYSSSVVTFARLIPAVRSLISIPAGVAKMNLGRFLIFSALGTVVWTTFLTVAGYMLGSNYSSVEGPIAIATDIIIILAVVIYIYRIVRYYNRKKNRLKTG